MTPNVTPIILLGVAAGAFKRGEDSLGYILLAGIALLLIANLLFEMERERKRIERESHR